MKLVYGYDEVLPTQGADAEQVMNTLAGLSRAGVDVDLLLARAGDPAVSGEALKRRFEVAGDFRIHHITGRVRGGRVREKLAHARNVAAHPIAAGADVIHTRNLPTVRAALAAGLRVVYDTYRPWPRQYPILRPWLRRLLRHPGLLGVMTHSEFAADSYLELGLPRDTVIVAHNGYDPARMEPRLSQLDARRALGLDERRPVVTYTGRVDPDKGIGVILELARRCPDIDFIVVGSHGEGPLEREGAAISNLRFVAWQPYAATVPYLYAADMLLIPPTLVPLKRHGSTVLPLKTFLYLAAGRVIVAPDAPDTRELLRHDDNAVLVPPDDVAACAAAIQRTAADGERMERIAAQSLASASELTWDARGRHIVEFIERRLAA